MTVGVLRQPLGRGIRAEDVFDALCGDETNVFWLDGGSTSYVGAGEPFVPGPSVLDALRHELSAPPRHSLGIVGWLGYEVLAETTGRTAESVPQAAVPPEGGRRSAYPHAAFLRVDRVVALHDDGSAELLAAGERWEGDLDRWRIATIELLAPPPATPATATPGKGAAARADAPAPHQPPAGRPAARAPSPAITWRDTDDAYLAKIAACQSAIRAGDAYVLNLTTEVTVRGAIDPVAVYRELRRESPGSHGALLRIGSVSLLSASPEVFLEVSENGRVSTSPVKGTRGRSADRSADARAAVALAADPKERAENTMIVDLMRNDLARVCVPGTVEVTSLLRVETHPQVHQLVSTVEGMLRDGLGAVDAVEATFPAGSMTGTPKQSAIAILDRLEDRARGLYSGAFGFFAAGGRAELAMTIRSIVVEGDRATVGVGGGITALSVPAAELAETKLKAAALLRALRSAGNERK